MTRLCYIVVVTSIQLQCTVPVNKCTSTPVYHNISIPVYIKISKPVYLLTSIPVCSVPAPDSELASGGMESEVVSSCTVQGVQAVPGSMDGLHCTVLYCIVLYCTLLYTVQGVQAVPGGMDGLHCTALYCTLLYIVLYTVHCTGQCLGIPVCTLVHALYCTVNYIFNTVAWMTTCLFTRLDRV